MKNNTAPHRVWGQPLTWSLLLRDQRLREVLEAGEEEQGAGSQQQEEPQGAVQGAGQLHHGQ